MVVDLSVFFWVDLTRICEDGMDLLWLMRISPTKMQGWKHPNILWTYAVRVWHRRSRCGTTSCILGVGSIHIQKSPHDRDISWLMILFQQPIHPHFQHPSNIPAMLGRETSERLFSHCCRFGDNGSPSEALSHVGTTTNGNPVMTT